MFFICNAIYAEHLASKRVNPIERIREGIIFKEEGFKTYDEIRDQCENAGVIIKETYMAHGDTHENENVFSYQSKKMNGIKRSYLYLVILAVVDFIVLLATYIFEIYYVFLILLMINIVLVAVIVAVSLFSQLFRKRAVGSEEFYGAIIKKQKGYVHSDDNLLGKMFEIRITNWRQSIFGYLVFLLTYTLAISLNSETICPFSNVLYLLSCRLIIMVCASVGVAGIVFFSYQSAMLDRYAIEELDKLFKLKKESDEE